MGKSKSCSKNHQPDPILLGLFYDHVIEGWLLTSDFPDFPGTGRDLGTTSSNTWRSEWGWPTDEAPQQYNYTYLSMHLWFIFYKRLKLMYNHMYSTKWIVTHSLWDLKPQPKLQPFPTQLNSGLAADLVVLDPSTAWPPKDVQRTLPRSLFPAGTHVGTGP